MILGLVSFLILSCFWSIDFCLCLSKMETIFLFC